MTERRDPYQVWDGTKFQFTLRKLCAIIYEGGTARELPETLRPLADKPVARVMACSMPAKKGLRVTFDLPWRQSPEESAETMTELLQEGVVVVTDRHFAAPGGEEYPVIAVDDPWEAWVKLGRYVMGVFPMPTVAITGSVGKTTATEFARCVFDERYRTFVSGLDGANFNSPLQIVNQWLLRAGPDYTFHVQECGAETPRLVERAARIVDADAFGITNIDTTQHIAAYKTAENLIADKTSFDRVRKDSAFAVINLDDAILRDFPFQSPRVTFAIEDQSADFVGKNIVQNGELLEFDVAHAGGETHIRIHILGVHNVYNALLVFAFAKKFGLTDEEIQRGFLNYRAVGIRQNLRRVAGRLVYMDCYNASVESTRTAVRTLEELRLDPGARRIAVVGERSTSSEETYKINYELGRSLAQFEKLDELIVVGEDLERATGHPDSEDGALPPQYRNALYSGARSVLGEDPCLIWCDDLTKLADRLRFLTRTGDAILFKGRYHLSLWAAADMAFGTCYTRSPAVLPLGVTKETVSGPQGGGVDYAALNGVDLTRGAEGGIDNTKLILPDSLAGRPVVRIGDGAFAYKSQLKHVILGANVRAIGDRAFQGCRNLEQAELPMECLYVGEAAYENCTSLVRASMPGACHISAGAFRGCTGLREALLTERCAAIEEEAFAGCDKLTILAPAGSYAAAWAAENGFALETTDTEEELDNLAKNGTRLRSEIYAMPPLDGDGPAQSRDRDRLTVTVAGDIMAHTELLEACHDEETGAYDFSPIFARTERYFRSADLAIGNLETVLGHGTYTSFPTFNSPDELAEAMCAAGFDVAACANNHSLDGGLAGVLRTERVLRDMGLEAAGIRANRSRRAWVMAERSGVKIAVVNFTYLTSALDGKVMNSRHPVSEAAAELINTFCFETLDDDLERVGAEIAEARREGADIVLVYYHWGGEYATRAGTVQRYMAQRTAEMGADAIVGSHAHVPQEMDAVTVSSDGGTRTVPVFYGLGNYCWSARQSRTGREMVQCGVLAQLDIGFDREARRVTDIQAGYVPLYIKMDYAAGRWDVNVLPLEDLTAEELAAFERHNTLSAAEILGAIRRTLHGDGAPEAELRSQRAPELAVGQWARANGTFLDGDETFTSIRSENAPVAAVLQSGEIIGCAPGVAGIAAVMPDGREVRTVVKVTGRYPGVIPVPVDEHNCVPDTYVPPDLLTGWRYGMPQDEYLREPAAKAWRVMQIAAKLDGVHMKCISGYRSAEAQLRMLVACREAADRGERLPAAAPVGCSEHQTGMALDVTGDEWEDGETTPEEASQWLEDNAAAFGFILRPAAGEFRHMRYVGSAPLARVLQAENAGVPEYLARYGHFQDVLAQAEAWRGRYLTEEERAQSPDKWDKLTLGRIFALAGAEPPAAWAEELDRIVPRILLTDARVEPGAVIFYDKGVANARPKCRSAVRKGAALIVTDTPITDCYGAYPPQAAVPDSSAAWMKVAAHLRRQYKGKLVGIAEKGLRHGLRDTLAALLEGRFDVLKSAAAQDSRLNVLDIIQQLPGREGVCLQNLPRYGARMAELLQPDVAVFTGLPDSTPPSFSSRDAYWADQLSLLDRTLERGGTALINGDEPHLWAYAGRENVVTFGAGDGADIRLTGLWTDGGTWTLSVTVKGEPTLWSADRGTAPVNAASILAALAACAAAEHLAPGAAAAKRPPAGLRYVPGPGCVLRRGWLEEGGKRYYLSQKDGHVLTGGPFKTDGRTYCAGPDGALRTGFVDIEGAAYYFSPEDGAMRRGGVIRADGRQYYLDADGHRLSGCTVTDSEGRKYTLSGDDGHVAAVSGQMAAKLRRTLRGK